MDWGYLIISIDYEKDSDSDRLLYNVGTFGLALKSAFNF